MSIIKKTLTFYLFLILILLNWPWLCKPRNYETGDIVHSLRLTNYSKCNKHNHNYTMSLSNIQWISGRYIQFLNGECEILTRIVTHYMSLDFERCYQPGYGCEDFRSWNFSAKMICQLGRMKNKFWSSIVYKFTPSHFIHTCPILYPTNYVVRNGTLETEELVKFWPDMPKYYWKVRMTLNDKYGKALTCSSLDGYFVTSTFRESRKPRH